VGTSATGPINCGSSRAGGAFAQFLRAPQAFAAVAEVGAHRRTRRLGVAPCDGAENVLVLVDHALKVVGRIVLRQPRGIEPRARDDVGAEVAQDVVKITVARGLRNEQVELHVRFDRLHAPARALLEAVQRRAQLNQLLVGAAVRRQSGRFGLEADAQFQQRQHEGADATARLDQAGRLQVRDRLAHHGAAHAQQAHDLGLGRQLLAGLQAAVPDAVPEVRDDALRQVAVFFQGCLCGLGRIHGQGRGSRAAGAGVAITR
jgi:hypothetical protein